MANYWQKSYYGNNCSQTNSDEEQDDRRSSSVASSTVLDRANWNIGEFLQPLNDCSDMVATVEIDTNSLYGGDVESLDDGTSVGESTQKCNGL